MIVDFRKQLDGLIVLVIEALDKDPSSGDLFVYLEINPATSLNVFTLMGDAFERKG